jgi:predicted ATPase
MNNYITKIDTHLAFTQKNVLIELKGKNLIITGGNGCGKTQFLTQIFNTLTRILSPNFQGNIDSFPSQINSFEMALRSEDLPKHQRQTFQKSIKKITEELREHTDVSSQVIINNYENITDEDSLKLLVLRFFKATRQYSPAKSSSNVNTSVQSMLSEAKTQDLRGDSSVKFETYLVTYLNAGYMAYALRGDESEKSKVDSWLKNITSDLRYLFEDENLRLEYKENEKCFYLIQDGKLPYKFDQLSAGYSSILKIYTDLLMKVELRGIKSKELSGFVFIDEIDAHLHVSLQKKIFSFLDNAYPNVQFIVSTHSPFVIQSVNDAVIYDLSRLEQLEDLSYYSYEAITKGLLGVTSTSNALDEVVIELSNLTDKVESNEKRVEELINQMAKHQDELNPRSKVVLLMAKEALLNFQYLQDE